MEGHPGGRALLEELGVGRLWCGGIEGCSTLGGGGGGLLIYRTVHVLSNFPSKVF